MAKEILLYTSINAWSVSDFITSLEANKGNDIVVRMNTPGGSVYDGYGAIAKFNEFADNKTLKVDGRADSFGAYFMCCVPTSDVECLDVSTFTFHRAAMPSWFEADANYFTDEVKSQLKGINDCLRAFIESKTTAQKWKNVTGVSLDDMFSLSSRIDVQITADKAKKLGMVGKVNKITPQKLAEIKAYSADLAAELTTHLDTETNNKTTIMTLSEIKANATLWAEVKAEILADEKDRVGAFAAFKEIDPAAVLAEIVAGNKFTQTFAATMSVKTMSKQGIENIAGASADPLKTGDATKEKTEDAQKIESFSKGLNTDLLSRFGITGKA